MGGGAVRGTRGGERGLGEGEVKRRAPGSPTHGHPSQPPSGARGLAWGTEVGRGPADGPRLRSRVNVGYGQAESPGPGGWGAQGMPPSQPGKWVFHLLSATLCGSLDLPRVPKSVLRSSELTPSPTYFLSPYPQVLAWEFTKALFCSGAGVCLTGRHPVPHLLRTW